MPDSDRVVILLSGGLDSTISMRLAIEKYGAKNIFALSFDYTQRQSYELSCATRNTKLLNIHHKIIDIGFLGDISKGFSSLSDKSMKMPSALEAKTSKQPTTYVPNRNMVLMSIAASYAEVIKASNIIVGFQKQDEYGYHDTTQSFIDSINQSLSQNRTWQIKIIAPFVDMSKSQELKKLLEIDGNLDLLKNTITCYNPTYETKDIVKSCGKCPSCNERLKAFETIGENDLIEYV